MIAGITALFTCYNVNAFFVDKPYQHCNWSDSQFFPNCSSYGDLSYSPNLLSSDYTDFNNLNYYTNGSSFANNRGIYGLNDGNNIVSSKLYSYNDGDYFNFTRGNQGSWNYNFINIYSVGSYYGFSWWSDSEKKYQSIDFSSLPILEDDVFAYFSPRHGMFTFYNRDYSEGIQTVQYIGNKRLRDYVIYVDPLDQDENIWLIDYYNLKAWSLYTGNVITINKFMFGSTDLQLGNRNFIDSLPRQNSYTMSLVNGSNYFYPHTDGNQACSPNDSNGANSNICKSSKYLNIGFSRTSDLEFQPPHFGNGGDNGDSSDDNKRDYTYEQCIDEINTIKNLAANQHACLNTVKDDCSANSFTCMSITGYNDLYNFLRYYDGSSQYTGQLAGVSCSSYYDKATKLYAGAWSGSYSSKFLTANSWSSDPNGIVADDYCSRYKTTDSSWLCENLGIGCDRSLQESIDYLSGAISPFLDLTWTPLKTAFLSGYNYFGDAVECNENYYGKSYAWGNFLIVFVVIRLFLALYNIFK